jgi:hypothetical protein
VRQVVLYLGERDFTAPFRQRLGAIPPLRLS